MEIINTLFGGYFYGDNVNEWNGLWSYKLCLVYYGYNARDNVTRILFNCISRNLGYNANLSFVSHEHDIKMVIYRLRVILALTKLYLNQCQDHINISLRMIRTRHLFQYYNTNPTIDIIALSGVTKKKIKADKKMRMNLASKFYVLFCRPYFSHFL